jgi:hypothetical protein
MSELVTVEPSSEAIEAAANYLVEISGRFGSNLPATFRWYDCLTRAYAIDVAPLIAKIEKLPALVTEINRLSAECAMRGKEVMCVYAERDRLSYKLHASMDGSAKHGYVEECRLLSAERDRLAAEVERLTVELGKARTLAEHEAANARVIDSKLAKSDIAFDDLMKAAEQSSSELSAARETIVKLRAALTAFLSAQQTNDRGEYAGWRISGRGSVNEAAERARAALAQLDAPALGHTDLMISPEAIDEALAAKPLPEELANPSRPIAVDYTNWRGERRVRKIVPVRIFPGSNQWHKEPQWLMEVVEPDDGETKTLAFAGIHGFVEKYGEPK